MDDLRMYGELAEWWHLVSDPADYAEEASHFVKLLKGACKPPPTSVLELGCGGGNNASHMKAHFHLTLTDVSSKMIEVSRSLNPDCEHVVGDMRTLRLGRAFDAVFAHDAIMYMLSEADLRAAMRTAFVHCRAGGVALFAPDYVSETFRGETKHGGHDGPTRSMRYLEWTHPPAKGSSTFVTEFVFMLRERDGITRVESDSHRMGLFGRDVWLELLREVGFEARLDRSDPYGRELFIGVRPAK